MPIDYPALGKRIAFFRNQSHLTQEDFAYEVHLSRQYISQLETAACRPSLETIVEIANTLGVSTILTRTLKELRAILYSLGV